MFVEEEVESVKQPRVVKVWPPMAKYHISKVKRERKAMRKSRCLIFGRPNIVHY